MNDLLKIICHHRCINIHNTHKTDILSCIVIQNKKYALLLQEINYMEIHKACLRIPLCYSAHLQSSEN